jgi:H+/Cl- antiporter ClcA
MTTVGGIVLGLVGWALPLTMFSGSSQLTTVLDNADEIGVAILATVLVAKMFTVMLSMSSGFIGGNVFPAIFLGGTAGALIHVLFPEVPYALAVAAMMAAVPGAFLQAPLTLIIIAAITVGVSPANLPAIAIAVVVSFIATSTINSRLQMRDER